MERVECFVDWIEILNPEKKRKVYKNQCKCQLWNLIVLETSNCFLYGLSVLFEHLLVALNFVILFFLAPNREQLDKIPKGNDLFLFLFQELIQTTSAPTFKSSEVSFTDLKEHFFVINNFQVSNFVDLGWFFLDSVEMFPVPPQTFQAS